ALGRFDARFTHGLLERLLDLGGVCFACAALRHARQSSNASSSGKVEKREFSRSLMVNRRLMGGCDAVVSSPAQPVFSTATRPVFSANTAAIAKLVHCLEHRSVVDLTFIRLVARGHSRALQMTDDRQEFFK